MTHSLTRRWTALLAFAVALLAVGTPGRAQMVAGKDMPGYAETFGLAAPPTYKALLTECSIPGNVLWPGDAPSFTFQIQNDGDAPLTAAGRVEVIAYGTKGAPGDVWTPHVYKITDGGSVPVAANVAAHGYQDVTVRPDIPARFGGYALVLDLGPAGRQFLTSCVRTFKATQGRVQYPKFCLDNLPPDVLKRLDVHAIRYGEGYKPTTDKDYAQWYADEGKKLAEYNAADVAVLFMVGGGAFTDPTQPMRHPRPWLDDKGVMQDGKFDLAWLPSYDADFQQWSYRFARDYGWPKGPINAFSLWNEPWEGISISGWGADMLRYREMYQKMYAGVAQARKNDGVGVLVGGTDSSSNALDKMFPDGTNKMLPMFDFLSIHYQGLTPMSTVKDWVNRKGYGGRVRIWDTESWVANTDDRVAAVVAGDRAAGYDRAMGVFGGNVASGYNYWETRQVYGADGKKKSINVVDTWSPAAAIGASQHFIGERPFSHLLFQNGLPWVMLFDGLNGNADDGTVVVVGDLGEEFGADNVLYRTARGQAEIAHKADLRAQLAALPPDPPVVPSQPVAPGTPAPLPTPRETLQTQLDTLETLSGATLTLAADPRFGLYDFYGNPVPAENGHVTVPLDGRGFFLRADGSRGSFAALTAALQAGHIEGIEPLAIVAHDFTASVESHPSLRLSLTNVLNRPVSGPLTVTLGGLTLAAPGTVTVGPNETRDVTIPVTDGAATAPNTYPLSVVFDGGTDGKAQLSEDVHANVIAHRTITVDGNLDDWKGVLPQTVTSGKAAPTLTEAAWFPFKNFDTSVGSGFATGYLAYDDHFFYFAAKVADSTPDPGMVRFATRNDDDYFYPEISYTKSTGGKAFSIRWTGTVTPKYSETYTFTTRSDDGVRLFVNGKQVIDNWTDHGATDDTATVALKAGEPCTLKMEYYNGAGGGEIHLFWQSASQPRTLVPADTLSGQYYTANDFNTLKLTRTDKTIDFTWGDGVWPDPAFGSETLEELHWPAGVRRYSYRKDPELPAGNAPSHDNVQIAFNVLPPDQKYLLPHPPGVMPGFTNYADTDYEYALNQVAPQYGGGTEIWRLSYPGMPRKHFYPRQPKSPLDGPAHGGKLVVTRDANTRIVECAIPWTEIPDVKKCLDAGRPIKFSFRVNDNAGGGTMELSRGRSVAKRNGSFHVDWAEHWANELEFGWGK